MTAGGSRANLLVVGAGPAGLAAAIEARHRGVGRVIVLDREAQAGGVPHYTQHIGYGARDLHRVLSGPAYARRYADLARQAGVEVLEATSAIDWEGPTHVLTTSRDGLRSWQADAILLATGCRERPRTARLVPGDRPAGIFTTGSLQRFGDTHDLPIGHRAVVVGAEHVSFSAVHTLLRHGVEVAAVVTDLPGPQTFRALRLATTDWHKVPVVTRATVAAITGRPRVTGVRLRRDGGLIAEIACDTVVFTGDWIPDNELARLADLPLDRGTRGPVTDQWLRTPVAAVFAAGNLVHAAESADVAALTGRHAAVAIASYLDGVPWPGDPALPVRVEAPLRWVFPSRLRPGDGPPPRGRFVLRASTVADRARLLVRQGPRTLHATSRQRYTPHRGISLPAHWIDDVLPDRGDITISLD